MALPAARAEPPYVSTQDVLLKQADELEQATRYQEAIALYEQLVHEGEGRDPRWTAYVLFRLAGAQYQSGDRVSAKESVAVAVSLDPEEPSYQSFQAELSVGQSGDKPSALYRARRDQGSAKRLTSTNGVLHIFVRGRNTDPWDPELEEKTHRHVEEADRWLQARAAESRVTPPPTFVHRYASLVDEPFWRRVDVPDAITPTDYRKAWLEAVLTRFNAGSFSELFDRLFNGMDLANRAVIFHTASRELTILVPYRKEPTDLESTFVSCEPSEWANSHEPVAYTHDLLHLYGADDLFNKVRDPQAPEDDVMNFGRHDLDDCTLCDLTRYAIGWKDQSPRLTRLRLALPVASSKKKGGTHG
jgi:hypothetical protein